ncbi:unknown [Bacteroides sp. CAG:875]|nr:unknown [Bacteroides sp. CAG:875]
MKTKMLLLGACVALLSSCASYRQTAPIIGYDNNRINVNVSADLDVQNAKKISATIETKNFLGIPLVKNGNKAFVSSTRYRSLSKRESQALYKAKKDAKVDIILDPEFTTEKHSWFFGAYKTSTTTVTGWGVNVKSITQ